MIPMLIPSEITAIYNPILAEIIFSEHEVGEMDDLAIIITMLKMKQADIPALAAVDLDAIEAELEAQGNTEPVKAAPEKKFGFVAVCAGDGLEAVFRDLGVDGIGAGQIQSHRVKGGEHTHIGNDGNIVLSMAVAVGAHIPDQAHMEVGTAVHHSLGILGDLVV